MRNWVLLLALGLVTSACAHIVPQPPAAAPDWGDAFTRAEDRTCSHFECENFMAPCDLMEAPRTRQTTALEDEYREKILAYKSIGYCLNTPRPVPDYTKGTCFFLLVRGERDCGAVKR